ncbi:RluA family pseudouridine synthase [Pasteuria penetrans]|uniref:RluA family pseudouridine synthase n=1 Tax=Pasteuria penetrans TaxID=86005 RepID=UPI001FE249D3|nr:RluA family pseudouridine synthase [Pasteuria penetrans]
MDPIQKRKDCIVIKSGCWEWMVGAAEEGQGRLDRALTHFEPSWSRTQVQSWIDAGRVLVDGLQARASQRVRPGMRIVVSIPPAVPSRLQPEDVPLDVRYEDDDVLVVNKPAGMVVHPAPGHYEGTLVNALLAHCGDSLRGVGGECRPGIVHRLDKDTSGLLVVAKHDTAHRLMTQQLRDRRVKRMYWALVQGRIPRETGRVDAPIARDPLDRKRFRVLNKGKRSITHYVVEKRFAYATLVRCRLETGRTHQIRVHCKYMGFPILGDPVYGPRKSRYHLDLPGQALHAGELGFHHPRTGEWTEVGMGLSVGMEQSIAMLEGVP